LYERDLSLLLMEELPKGRESEAIGLGMEPLKKLKL
jgi:hypothetical protein